MSAVPSEIRPSLKPGQSLISGRVAEVFRGEKSVVTFIKTPAEDQFSHPGFHKVVGQRLLGKPGDDIAVKVRLQGFRRTYKDKHGEEVTTADCTLYVIED